jgi:hypothetical protein
MWFFVSSSSFVFDDRNHLDVYQVLMKARQCLTSTVIKEDKSNHFWRVLRIDNFMRRMPFFSQVLCQYLFRVYSTIAFSYNHRCFLILNERRNRIDIS